MKKITFLIALILTATISFGQNLLSNGGFEGLTAGALTGTSTPWQSPSGGVSIINDNTISYSGDQFVIMNNDFRNLRQSITAVNGTEYTVTFWYQFTMPVGQITDPDDGMYISIRQDTGGNGTQFNPVVGIYIDPSIVNNTTWYQATFNFTATQTNLLFFVGKQATNADGDGGLNNSVRLDDFSIIATPTASINDLLKFNFKSSPNPAKDYINLSASKAIDKVEIYNLLGQQVKMETLNTTQNNVNVSSLSNGIYILKAYIEDAVGSYKFIKE